jgi:threonylcarbamoyladenosine tRNA methylthiotransferase MtaB
VAREATIHVLMTGPVEFEFEAASTRRCSRTGAKVRHEDDGMSVDVVTFGCRLNAYESEVMRREAEAAGSIRRRRQHLRRHRRGGAAGAAGDPQAARERPDARIVVTGCAAQTEPQTFAAMPEVDRVLGNEKAQAAWAMRRRFGANERRSRQRHHGGARDRAAPGRRHRGRARAPSCRCRTAATIAAPSASSPMAAAIRARCRWARWSSRCAARRNGYREVVLTGVDITSYGATCRARRRSASW